jgi:hypothetical protein
MLTHTTSMFSDILKVFTFDRVLDTVIELWCFIWQILIGLWLIAMVPLFGVIAWVMFKQLVGMP